jgi:uncharacterized protein (DUF2062 family)
MNLRLARLRQEGRPFANSFPIGALVTAIGGTLTTKYFWIGTGTLRSYSEF